MTGNLQDLCLAVGRYLCGDIAGADVVRYLDELVSSDKIYKMPEVPASSILELQNEVAMYVADINKRAEHPDYIGDEGLRNILASFLRKIGSRSAS